MNQIHAYTNANNANIDALSSDDYNLDISKKKNKNILPNESIANQILNLGVTLVKNEEKYANRQEIKILEDEKQKEKYVNKQLEDEKQKEKYVNKQFEDEKQKEKEKEKYVNNNEKNNINENINENVHKQNDDTTQTIAKGFFLALLAFSLPKHTTILCIITMVVFILMIVYYKWQKKKEDSTD